MCEPIVLIVRMRPETNLGEIIEAQAGYDAVTPRAEREQPVR